MRPRAQTGCPPDYPPSGAPGTNARSAERRCLRLEDSKTGRKTVYLNTAGLQILAALDRDPENPHMIQGNVPGNHLIGLTRIWFRSARRS